MTAAAPDSTLAITQLRAALEGTAEALAHADLTRLLTCEAEIERALALLPARAVTNGMSGAAVEDAERARLALTRCRRLGVALTETVRLAMQARGVLPGYGKRPSPDLDLHSLDTTV